MKNTDLVLLRNPCAKRGILYSGLQSALPRPSIYFCKQNERNSSQRVRKRRIICNRFFVDDFIDNAVVIVCLNVHINVLITAISNMLIKKTSCLPKLCSCRNRTCRIITKHSGPRLQKACFSTLNRPAVKHYFAVSIHDKELHW